MGTTETVKLKNLVTELDHAAGPVTAPVTLLEYGNFECIHCGRVFPVIKQLRRALGDNLRFVFRHFPTHQTHPHSLRAAEAAEAAGAQGRFWEMHDELFSHQTALEDRKLTSYAKRIGIDVERFTHDMSEHTFLKEIETGYQVSLFDEHVTGTPTIYLNDIRYTGATDLESLLHAIRQADTEGEIQMLESHHSVRELLSRLLRHLDH
jgi:protein-disulfide isomerase